MTIDLYMVCIRIGYKSFFSVVLTRPDSKIYYIIMTFISRNNLRKIFN
jgi:hypothetical protein